jgi:hypothetical protein
MNIPCSSRVTTSSPPSLGHTKQILAPHLSCKYLSSGQTSSFSLVWPAINKKIWLGICIAISFYKP